MVPVKEPMIFVAVRYATLPVASGILNFMSADSANSTLFHGLNLAQWSLIHARKDVYELLLAKYGPSLIFCGPLKDVFDMNYCLAISGNLGLIDFVLQDKSPEEKKRSEKEILKNITNLIVENRAQLSVIRPDMKLEDLSKVFLSLEERVTSQHERVHSEDLICELLFSNEFEKIKCLLSVGFKINFPYFVAFLEQHDEPGRVFKSVQEWDILNKEELDIVLLQMALNESYEVIIQCSQFGYKVPSSVINQLLVIASVDKSIAFITGLFAHQPFGEEVWTSLKNKVFPCERNQKLFDEGNVMRCASECEPSNSFPMTFKSWLYRQMHGPFKLVITALGVVSRTLNEVNPESLKSELPSVLIREMMPYKHAGRQCYLERSEDR